MLLIFEILFAQRQLYIVDVSHDNLYFTNTVDDGGFSFIESTVYHESYP